MEKIDKEKIKKWLHDPRNRTLLIALALMLVIIVAVNLTSHQTVTEAADPASADTYIPNGYVLVPIEIQNSESLSSLVGSYAIVDLFRGPGSQRVGRRLRLLRAPLNPQQFAVLVPEAEVSTLMSTPGPYWAAIQNPQERKSTEIAAHKKKSRIEYFQGN
jgi:hypothetical protein